MAITNWYDVFVLGIMGLVLLFGSPITQLIKNLLSKIFKRQVEERWALALSAVIACGLGLLEMFLNGQLTGLVLTPASFPAFAGTVFSVAQIYYGLFKKSANALGTKGLLKETESVSQGGITAKG